MARGRQKAAPAQSETAGRVRPNDMRDMTRDELEAYAREVGVHPRDIALPSDRLRVNVQSMLAARYDE